MRPDHWFPIIQFETSDGTVHTTTFRYGLLKKNWKMNEEVEIAWNDGEERNVYPYKKPIFMKKGIIYLAIGMLLSLLAASYYIPAISMFCSMVKTNFIQGVVYL